LAELPHHVRTEPQFVVGQIVPTLEQQPGSAFGVVMEDRLDLDQCRCERRRDPVGQIVPVEPDAIKLSADGPHRRDNLAVPVRGKSPD
jgi:hypothetical protein